MTFLSRITCIVFFLVWQFWKLLWLGAHCSGEIRWDLCSLREFLSRDITIGRTKACHYHRPRASVTCLTPINPPGHLQRSGTATGPLCLSRVREASGARITSQMLIHTTSASLIVSTLKLGSSRLPAL